MATQTKPPNASRRQRYLRGLSARDRLFRAVEVDKMTECWNWTGSKDTYGYGHMKVGAKLVLIHRLSYEIYRGSIPDTLHVLHKCDNRACANPAHLFLGTNADNVADKIIKGRQPRRPNIANRGSGNGYAKLSESDTMAILKANNVSQRELADRYGVSITQISRIRSGKRWQHLRS